MLKPLGGKVKMINFPNRKTQFQIIFSMAILLIVFIGSLSHYILKQNENTHTHSSITSQINLKMGKHALLHRKPKRNQFAHKAKGQIYVKLQVENHTKNLNEWLIKGTVKTLRPVPQLEINWTVPEGVSVISGKIQETIYNVEAKQEKTFFLRLEKGLTTPQLIHLHAYEMIEGERYGNITNYLLNSPDKELSVNLKNILFEKNHSGGKPLRIQQ